MIPFVLDTDTLSLYGEAHPLILQRVQSRPPQELAITVITVEETLRGWSALVRRSARPDQLARAYRRLAEAVPLLASFPILPFSEQAIARFGALRRLKLNVGPMDLRIAAIVLEAGSTLVTRNARDFGRVPGLAFVDWSV